MSRYCPHDITPILAATQRWLGDCLIEDGSVLSAGSLWTAAGFEELHELYVKRPDESDRGFLEKLRDQLRPALPSTKQLAAELLWVLYLFPHASVMGAAKKRADILEVWSWSGQQLTKQEPNLLAPLEQGVGNPGTAYHVRRWAEFAFLVEAVRQLKAKTVDERAALFSSGPWNTRAWLDLVDPGKRYQLRHILSFLLEPDYFERIASGGDKCQILSAFKGTPVSELRKWMGNRIDKELYELRQELEASEATSNLDFYRPPLEAKWRSKTIKGVGYWKIAPGDKARIWEKCRDGAFIAIGWDELGDLTGIDRRQFESRMAAVREKHPDWETDRLEQVWKFAQIAESDRIVANRGTREVLGIGTVTGPYYYVSGEEYGHRLPVRWDDVTPRPVSEGGWRRALVKLSEKKFNEIANAGQGAPAPGRRYWIEKTITSNRADRLEGEHALGRALWSPQRARNGSDIYREMLQVRPGDVVLHLTDNRAITGASVVAEKADASFVGLPGTEWAGQPGYRIPLLDFERAEPPLDRDQFLKNPKYREQLLQIAKEHSGLFYNSNLELNQGRYLTPAPTALIDLLNSAYRDTADHNLPHLENAGPVVSGDLIPDDAEEPIEINEQYTAEQLSEESGFTVDTINDWLAQIRRKKHFVLQGPPGTGKTYLAERLARILVSETRGFYETVQFHPSYAYEDFMQGIRPQVIEKQIAFKRVPGRFIKFCRQAAKLDENEPCVLIIDELNRANLSRVFGELMYLLEYREKDVPLSGGGKRFRVPRNVYVIGTMNTADRSIALVDHALRRRFTFAFLGPEYDILQSKLTKSGLHGESLASVLRLVNQAIGDRNYQIGISFFLADGPALRELLPSIWKGEIEPYLEEYFFDQIEKVEPLRWAQISKKLAGWV